MDKIQEPAYLDWDDALHLDHSVSQGFDLLVLHVVLQLDLLQETFTIREENDCDAFRYFLPAQNLTSRMSVSLSM